MYIPVVLGTARKGAHSNKVAKYLVDELKGSGLVKTKLLKVEKFIHGRTVPDWQSEKHTKAWSDEADVADGFIFIVPEYNHGYPGELKMLLDLVFDEYYRKPCLLVGVSAGHFGGVRALDNLLPVVSKLGMVVTGNLFFGDVGNIFNEKGKIKDASSWQKRVKKQYDVLYEQAQKLQTFRENKKSA